MLEVVTTEKNEPRIRALVVQVLALPDFTLRSLDIRSGKEARVRVMAGISAPDSAGRAGLEGAVQRIGLDPKVLSSRWWPAEAED
jgi:putative Mg2+ transporter-C (MgtC) family protein